MRTIRTLLLALAGCLLGGPARADETPVKGKIIAVDLFKNGLAAVTCEARLARPGVYILDEVPSPVHGTFWVDSPGSIEASAKMVDVEVPVNESPPGNLQNDLGGKKVTLHLKGGNRPPVIGTMMKLKPARADEAVAPGRYLLVQTAKGRVYVDSAEVGSVEAEDSGGKVTRRRPRFLLTLGPTDKAETPVQIRYLTNGLAWAPSYRIDISHPKSLTLEQHATIRNELANLDGAELRLISGYPSVQFAHVRSLLAPRASLATFFQELAGSSRWQEIDGLSNSVATQQVAMNIRSQTPAALGAIPTGEGVDLHYQPIGKKTLAEGESLAITVAKGKAEYERIVEWLIPDSRDEYGRHEGRTRENDDAWDALRFKNPLSFPMTTGPAMVTANGQFNGQRMSYWVNAGEETVLRVEKALSVRTRATENEQLNKDGSGRDIVWIGGRQYRKSTVEGEVAINNNRKETISMVVRRRFSGELIQAEAAPRTSLLTEGVYSINKRYEMVWSFPLKGGEQVRFKYSYSVLVLN